MTSGLVTPAGLDERRAILLKSTCSPDPSSAATLFISWLNKDWDVRDLLPSLESSSLSFTMGPLFSIYVGNNYCYNLSPCWEIQPHISLPIFFIHSPSLLGPCLPPPGQPHAIWSVSWDMLPAVQTRNTALIYSHCNRISLPFLTVHNHCWVGL